MVKKSQCYLNFYLCMHTFTSKTALKNFKPISDFQLSQRQQGSDEGRQPYPLGPTSSVRMRAYDELSMVPSPSVSLSLF